jgi:hypothetical protein
MQAHALYAQDSWQVKRFTLTYGLRWEIYPFPTRGRRNLHRQGLVMTRNTSTGFEDCRCSRKQQRRTPLQGSTGIVGACRGGIRMGARRGTRLCAVAVKQVDSALVGAVHCPVKRPVAVNAFSVRIGSFLQQPTEPGRVCRQAAISVACLEGKRANGGVDRRFSQRPR